LLAASAAPSISSSSRLARLATLSSASIEAFLFGASSIEASILVGSVTSTSWSAWEALREC
jgi:hypothetical protein